MSDIRWGNVSLDRLEESGNLRMDVSEDNGCMANEDMRPEKLNNTAPAWKHSAFKQIAYFFTYKLFDYFVKGK